MAGGGGEGAVDVRLSPVTLQKPLGVRTDVVVRANNVHIKNIKYDLLFVKHKFLYYKILSYSF